jgi:L-alanine-DL-glutamate epimerase-like enolase superfamily enzyme
MTGPILLSARREHWPYRSPFHITFHVWTGIDVLVVTLRQGAHTGYGEAAGIYFKGEQAAALLTQVQTLGATPPSRASLRHLLPAGGARNAIDCALWDLEAKTTGVPVWQRAGVPSPRPLQTTYTLGADTPDAMRQSAAACTIASALKLKLTGDGQDAERVRLVRAARPDAWIGVDANQGFTPDTLDHLMPTLVDNTVQLIEQPFPVGQEAWLDGLHAPIPLAADESVCVLADLERVAGRVQVVNIKLDKTGGLTHALDLAAAARRMGLRLMVGNMGGTSLAMAPGFVLAQLCDLADLDGPTVLVEDRPPGARYEAGMIDCLPVLWGGA